jgi:hypothetical protein
MFVLLKIYRIPAENPIIWQQSLIDSEVTAILQGRYNERKKKATKAKSNEIVARKEIEDEECEW